MKSTIWLTILIIFFLGGIALLAYMGSIFPGQEEWAIIQINEDDGDFGVLLMPVNECSTYSTLEEALEATRQHLSHSSHHQ